MNSLRMEIPFYDLYSSVSFKKVNDKSIIVVHSAFIILDTNKPCSWNRNFGWVTRHVGGIMITHKLHYLIPMTSHSTGPTGLKFGFQSM